MRAKHYEGQALLFAGMFNCGAKFGTVPHFFIFKHPLFLLTSITASSMPPKKTVALGARQISPAAAPSKSGRQRTLTNKQQQLGNMSSFFVVLANYYFPALISCPEKKEGGGCKSTSIDWCYSVRAALRGS